MIYSIETLVVSIDTICIYGSTGNIYIREIFFMAFIGADMCLWIYKKMWFSYCFGKGWVVVVVERRVDVKSWTISRGMGGYQNWTSVNKGEGDQNFGHFVRT